MRLYSKLNVRLVLPTEKLISFSCRSSTRNNRWYHNQRSEQTRSTIMTSSRKKTIEDLSDADLKGKKVLIRCDLNVPLDGEFVICTIMYVFGNARFMLWATLTFFDFRRSFRILEGGWWSPRWSGMQRRRSGDPMLLLYICWQHPIGMEASFDFFSVWSVLKRKIYAILGRSFRTCILEGKRMIGNAI